MGRRRRRRRHEDGELIVISTQSCMIIFIICFSLVHKRMNFPQIEKIIISTEEALENMATGNELKERRDNQVIVERFTATTTTGC